MAASYIKADEGRHELGELPSNRSFGWLATAIFILAGAHALWRGNATHLWIFALAGATAAITIARPQWLTPLNRGWARFGELLHRVVSPFVLGVIFFCIFTPVGCLMRIAGRDAMKRRFEPSAETYWVKREPPGPDADSFPNQF